MAVTDNNYAEANATVGNLAQLHTLDPDLLILPAHDRVAWKNVFASGPKHAFREEHGQMGIPIFN